MPGPFLSVHRLLWNANTEPDVAGYRVYAGRATRTYGSLGTPVDVGAALFYDWPINASGLWFFAVKAYDTANNESNFSAEVSANWLILGNF